MLQTFLQRSIDMLSVPEVQGPQAHMAGGADRTLRSRKGEFFTTLSKAEQAAQMLNPSQEVLYAAAARRATTEQLKLSATEIAQFAFQAPQANVALLRHAAEAAGFVFSAEQLEDSFVATTESILIEISKRSLDIQVSVYSGDVAKAKLEVEAKELARAMKAGDLEELMALMRGVINRAECVLNQRVAPNAPAESAGRGWGGALGIELHLQDISSGVRCWLNYEVPSKGANPMFFASIRPSLLVSPNTARRLAQGEIRQLPPCDDASDLTCLVRSFDQCTTTVTVTFSAPQTFETISFFTVESEDILGETSSKCPLIGRVAHSDLSLLETNMPSVIARLANMNALLERCFKRREENRNIALDSVGTRKRCLFMVALKPFARGLTVEARGELSFDLLIDTETLTVEGVILANGEQMDHNANEVGTRVLRQSMYLPAVVHTFAYLNCL
jgi:hypothetical protein